MTQLVKHYWINRDTGGWATDTRFGLMMPSIEGLEVQYQLTDGNDIPYCLSHTPDYFEEEITVGLDELKQYSTGPECTVEEQLQNYISSNNIDSISTSQRTYTQQIASTQQTSQAELDNLPSEEQLVTVYDIRYKKPHIIEESEGLSIITQEQWDAELVSYDERQIQKRYDILRINRDKMLELTDWMVIRDLESGSLSDDFKTWRQSLRDLPNSATFPSSYPPLPVSLENNNELKLLNDSFNQVRSIPMFNDPLHPLPEPESPIE